MTLRITWIKPEERMEHEFVQCLEEGRDVSDLKTKWDEIKTESASSEEIRERVCEFETLLREIPAGPFEADEPSGLEDIFQLCAAPETLLCSGLERCELEDKLLGAWLGRAAGCLLGKPVEGKSRAWIRELLDKSHNWPLDNYFTAEGIPPEVFAEHNWHKSYVEALRENIVCMPEDDDMNYPMLNLYVAEEFGPNFTPENVLQTWLTTLPVLQVFTAERVAYFNALQLLTPPQTAAYPKSLSGMDWCPDSGRSLGLDCARRPTSSCRTGLS